MTLEPKVITHLDALPSAAGKRAVVTGGNSGLGRELVRFLAHKGAAVVIAARDLAKAEAARVEVLSEVPGADISVEELDLASLVSVERAAGRLASAPIDVLLCNAGIMAVDRRLTEDGFEAQLGVNHLGHFALVGHLWDGLSNRAGARVVSVTSGAGYLGRMAFEDLMGERKYGRWRAYNQSKLANMLFTEALAGRFQAAGGHATAHAAHPGLVATQLQRNVLDTAEGIGWWEKVFLERITPAFGQGVQMGALPLLYAALSDTATNGDLWAPHRPNRGRPAPARKARSAENEETQERLWRVSEELTGVTYG